MSSITFTKQMTLRYWQWELTERGSQRAMNGYVSLFPKQSLSHATRAYAA
jgi:hypothetical protein